MSDIRPVPEMKSTDKPSRREKLQSWGVGATALYHKSTFFAASNKALWLIVLQLLGALAILIGISYFSIPCALIVGGIGAILVAERQ